MTVQIEDDGQGLTIKLEGAGMGLFFLRTLMRAKFYDDDGGLEGLLSPPLNSAIKATLETLGLRQREAAAYYAEWVAHHHQARVQALISTSLSYRSASPAEQQAMMRNALYPGVPSSAAPA